MQEVSSAAIRQRFISHTPRKGLQEASKSGAADGAEIATLRAEKALNHKSNLVFGALLILLPVLYHIIILYQYIISKLYLYFMDIRSMPSTPNSGGAAKGGSRSPSAEEKSCRGGRCDKRCQRCRLKWDDSVVILGDDEDDPWTGESGDKVTAIHVVSDEYRLRRCVWCNSRRYLAWVDQFGLLF